MECMSVNTTGRWTEFALMMSTRQPLFSTVHEQHHLVASSVQKATKDEGVAEFCRFYIDRRKQELTATGADPRKRKKIEDDFTPRLEAHLVGLEGSVRRQFIVKGIFELGAGHEYASSIEVIPSENKITKSPELFPCSRS